MNPIRRNSSVRLFVPYLKYLEGARRCAVVAVVLSMKRPAHDKMQDAREQIVYTCASSVGGIDGQELKHIPPLRSTLTSGVGRHR